MSDMTRLERVELAIAAVLAGAVGMLLLVGLVLAVSGSLPGVTR